MAPTTATTGAPLAEPSEIQELERFAFSLEAENRGSSTYYKLYCEIQRSTFSFWDTFSGTHQYCIATVLATVIAFLIQSTSLSLGRPLF